MSSIGLNTGLKALLSARFALDTVGHNIANANTPGYSRQSLRISSSLPLNIQGLQIGSGVDTDQVQRTVDELLSRRILIQRGIAGGLASHSASLGEFEAFLAEPGENGLSAALDSLFASISQLSTAPDDQVLKSSMAQSGSGLALRFNDLTVSLGRIADDARTQIVTEIDEVNHLAAEIAALNVSIGSSEASGTEANDLRDRRGLLLDRMSELVDIRVVDGPNGSATVLVEGNVFVGSATSRELTAETGPGGDLVVRIAGGTAPLSLEGGRIGGLMRFANDRAPDYLERLDSMARNLIREFNRVHSRGVPADGPFQQLSGIYSLVDVDMDGSVTDERLANAGLPFEVSSGSLLVNVTNRATGEVSRQRIEISATHTTVSDFVAELNAIPGISAGFDSEMRLQIGAATGFGVDFSAGLPANPDVGGTFGGAQASLGTGTAEPFAFVDGDTLDLTVDGGGGPVAIQVVLNQADFQNIGAVGAEELAAVLNQDPAMQTGGMVAVAVDGRVFLQTQATGPSALFRVDGGTAVGALGLGAHVGQNIRGSDDAVAPQISGSYTGQMDRTYVFRPNMDGIIGTTPGLAVEVFDENGTLVATLPVGDSYVPGGSLDMGQGISVAFQLGELSATHGDTFVLEATPDSDSAGVLVALGLNALFQGTGASDIALRSDLERNPDLIASSGGGDPGDSSLLLEMLSVERRQVDELSGSTLGGFYSGLVSDLGFEVATVEGARTSNQALIESLESRRDALSGVNVDEELVDLVAFEQAFAAAAEFLSVVNQMGEEILNLI